MPQEVSAELRRVAERWRQLPLTTAEARMPLVRRLLDTLAGDLGPVPDLGPAVVMDQLAVLVHDACAAAPPGSKEARQELAGRLTALRKTL
ncbi:hypothetical protein [Lapillicoccus sp.]|uniref:hypothetical protein n=1 Tax=Lapillicoccus sp. TaxID=1909287 RepID=UPI0025DDED0C|nr:hypothetical protein [Lapillicoccus sp.]